MNRELLDRWCERGILGLVLAILVWGPLATGAVRAFDFLVLQGLALGVMALWVARLWLQPRPQFLWPPITWAVLAFVAYAIGRYCTADIEYLARQELVRIAVYAVVFLAVLNNLHRQESTQVISFTLVFVAMAIAGYAVYQYLTGSSRVLFFSTPYQYRGTGTFISPNHLGGFLEMILPLGLAYALTGRVRPVTRIMLGYATLVMLAGVAVSVSRGSWAATALAVTVFFGLLLFHRRYRLPALAALGVLLLAGAVVVPKSYMAQLRVKRALPAGSRTDFRVSVWGATVEMWRDNPWFGVGPAHFDARFNEYRPEGIQKAPVWSHNDYLNALADWGVAGTALVLAAWGLLAAGVVKTWRYVRSADGDLGPRKGSNRFAFVLGGSIGLVAILAHSVVDFNMHIPANAILAVTLMAMLSGCVRFATDRCWVRGRLWLKAVVTVVLVAGAAWLGQEGWRREREETLLRQAERAPRFSEDQAELLKRAFQVEPMNPETAFQIAEGLRRRSQEGVEAGSGSAEPEYQRLAREATEWYGRSLRLNPYNARACAGYGWCLDWLNRPDEAGEYYARAEELDPNNYYILNSVGMHQVERRNYAAARPWFERSLRLEWANNPVARAYLQLAEQNLRAAATNQFQGQLNLLAP